MVAPEHPFDRVVNALRDRGYAAGKGCYVRAVRARLRCPNHDDRNPSLVVTRGNDDRALLHCFGGCKVADILARLNLRMADLFRAPRERGLTTKPTIAATYDYYTREGTLIAQKVRLLPKAFRWRRPDPSGRREWLWGLDGLAPGLYRLPELIDCNQVYLCEGEKATDYLWSLGAPATCPPVGASKWDPAWSSDLVAAGCNALVILADHDASGEQHAERVAAAVYGLAIPVTVVHLPGLQRGADVFDWLNGGHSLADLANVVLEAPYWSPESKEQQRLDRRRALTRARVAKWRAARNAPNVTEASNAAYVQDRNAGNAVTLPNVLLDHFTKVSIQ